jgi:GT2 family glycosyltransferase
MIESNSMALAETSTMIHSTIDTSYSTSSGAIHRLRRFVVLGVAPLLIATIVIGVLVSWDASVSSITPSSLLLRRQRRQLLIIMPETVEIKSPPLVRVPDAENSDGDATQSQALVNNDQPKEKGPMRFRCNSRIVPGEQIQGACHAPPPATMLPMAAIVQVYNHEKQAAEVIQSLTSQSNMAKILVYEDGSTDGSLAAYQQATAGLLHAEVLEGGNVHEIRNYNKGMEKLMADESSNNIELFALMQDDDILTTTEKDDWGPRASELFQRHPSLCVLGGYVAWNHVEGGKLRGQEYYGNEKSYNPKLEKVHFKQPCGAQTFRFVGVIASSPMILRKSCVQELGLLSNMSTEPGDPGIMFDVEYSLRAWASEKWTVGLYQTEFTHGVGGHSSMKNQELRLKRLDTGNRARKWLQAHYHGAHLHCTYEHSEGNRQLPT